MSITHYPPLAPVPYELLVAQGQVPNTTAVFRSAHNLNVTSTTSTLWSKGSLYTFPVSASTMTLYSTSTLDITQSVLIQGLDTNYLPISEVLVLNGQTGRTTTNSYLRINTMTVLTDSPVGDIALGTGGATAGVPVNTYGFIKSTENITAAAVYTVPAGYTLYLTSGSISAGDSSGSQTITANFYSRINGVVYLTSKIVLADAFQYFDYKIPLAVPEKTDVWNNVQASGSTLSAAATFNGYLIKNS